MAQFVQCFRAKPNRPGVLLGFHSRISRYGPRTSVLSALLVPGQSPFRQLIHSTPKMDTFAPIDIPPTTKTSRIPEHLFSPNSSPDTIAEAGNLLASTTRPWSLTQSPPGLQRKIKFKTFSTAMKFWNAVADECKAQKHHPEWGNVYNLVVIKWTTHYPRGISSKDIHMAKFCDKIATELGEVNELPVQRNKSNQTSPELPIAAPSEVGIPKTSTDKNSKNFGISTIPYISEIAYPGMPSEGVGNTSDLLVSLLGTEEHACMPCRTRKEKSRISGTTSGLESTNIKPENTSPHLESTEGQSVLEEMRKKRDGMNLAEPGFGDLGENVEGAAAKEKSGRK